MDDLRGLLDSGRQIEPRRVVLWLAVTEIAADLRALAVAATAA